jgi:hypothetical protein
MSEKVTDETVLTVKQAIPLSKLGRSLFYRVLGTRRGPPIKRVGDRILIPAEKFRIWLTTPDKPRKGKR